MSPVTIEIAVRYTCGGYVTSTKRGVRASSTCSASAAASKFGQKFFGPAFIDVTNPEGDTWFVTGDPTWYAACRADGVIVFLPELPPHPAVGPLVFASGPKRALEEAVAVAARHGKGEAAGLLLMPGVPEAPNQKIAMDALLAFVKWRSRINGLPVSQSVEFSARRAA